MVASASLSKALHLMHFRISPGLSLTSVAIDEWTSRSMAYGCAVLSDEQTAFSRSMRRAVFTKLSFPSARLLDALLGVRSSNTILSNLNQASQELITPLGSTSCSNRHLRSLCFGYNRSFVPAGMSCRIVIHAASCFGLLPCRLFRLAERRQEKACRPNKLITESS